MASKNFQRASSLAGVMVFCALFFALLGAPPFHASLTEPAQARMPDGYTNCEGARARARCDAWWNRRSSTQRKWLESQDMVSRNSAVVCLTLLGFPEPNPQLEDCTRRQAANRMSLDYCVAQGHDIMGEETQACQMKWKRDNGYPADR